MDGIEIYLQDADDYTREPVQPLQIFKWAYGQTREMENSLPNHQIAWQELNNGYRIELFIPYKDLDMYDEWAYNYYMRFELQVNDVDSTGETKSGRWWSDNDSIEDHPEALGLIRLGSYSGDCMPPITYQCDPCYFDSNISNDDDFSIIRTFTLSPNYPNPFNPHTTINYSLSGASHVILKIFDITGREVEEVFHERQGTGLHQVVFDAGHLPSGVYVYELKAGNQVERRKMTLL